MFWHGFCCVSMRIELSQISPSYPICPKFVRLLVPYLRWLLSSIHFLRTCWSCPWCWYCVWCFGIHGNLDFRSLNWRMPKSWETRNHKQRTWLANLIRELNCTVMYSSNSWLTWRLARTCSECCVNDRRRGRRCSCKYKNKKHDKHRAFSQHPIFQHRTTERSILDNNKKINR